jgi:hypothetical protein
MNAPLNHDRARRGRQPSFAIWAIGGLISLGLAAAVISTTVSQATVQPRHAIEMLTQSSGNAQIGRTQATRLLLNNGPDSALLSALGVAADRQGHKDSVARFMVLSGQLSWRDLLSDVWLLQHDFAVSDFDGALQRADALLRIKPDLGPNIYPVLITASADPRVSQAIGKRLAYNPNWRGAFLTALTGKAAPPVAYAVLQRLQSTPAPVTLTEASGYIQHLVDQKQYDQAFLGMMLFLPQRQQAAYSNLFNGKFDDIAGIAPFDWTLHTVSGASVSIEPRPDNPKNRALHVLADGNTTTDPIVYQDLVLPPGSYALSGQIYSPAPENSETFQWILTCQGGAVLAQSGFKAQVNWSKFQLPFIVPNENCGGQMLELAPQASDRRASADIWYDDLIINRIEAAQ